MFLERSAFQQVVEFAALFQDRGVPRARSALGLILPLQKMHEQYDEPTEHFSSIAFGHGGEELAQVGKVQLLVASRFRVARHQFEPRRLIGFVQNG